MGPKTIKQQFGIPPGMHITEIPFGLPLGSDGKRGRHYVAMLIGDKYYCLSDSDAPNDVRSWGTLTGARTAASSYIKRSASVEAIVSLDINGSPTFIPVDPEHFVDSLIGQYTDAGSW